MYINNIKLFPKRKKKRKKLETVIQKIRIYKQNIEMEFVKEKCAMLKMKSGKR